MYLPSSFSQRITVLLKCGIAYPMVAGRLLLWLCRPWHSEALEHQSAVVFNGEIVRIS